MTRLLKAAQGAGYTSARVEIAPDGTIAVIVGDDKSEPVKGANDFDALIERIKPDA